jgi:hypothetical protein
MAMFKDNNRLRLAEDGVNSLRGAGAQGGLFRWRGASPRRKATGWPAFTHGSVDEEAACQKTRNGAKRSGDRLVKRSVAWSFFLLGRVGEAA